MPTLNKAILVSMLAVILLPSVSMAQDEYESGPVSGPESMRGMTVEERRAAYEALSEEEKQVVRKRRRAAREKMRAELQAMTPEERDAKRAEMRAREEELTPEQRAAIQKRRERNKNAALKRNNQSRPQPDAEEEPDPQQ